MRFETCQKYILEKNKNKMSTPNSNAMLIKIIKPFYLGVIELRNYFNYIIIVSTLICFHF